MHDDDWWDDWDGQDGSTTPAVVRIVWQLVAQDTCPRCLGELDTGWQCNDCGYDARPVADTLGRGE